MPMKLSCPCGNVLHVSEGHAGKRVKCPKCAESMLVPQEEIPAARKAGSSGSKVGRFVLLGLVAILVVGGALGVWALLKGGNLIGPPTGPEGDGPEVSDLTLLPPDVQMVMTIRLAEVYKLPAAKEAIEKERQRDPRQEDPAARMERDTGLRPEEVERLHVVGLDMDKQQGWVVARTAQPIDRDKVLSKLKGRVELRHEGRRYYLGKNSANEETSVHFAGPKVLVMAGEPGMKRAMEQASKPVTDGPLKPTIALGETSKSQAIVGLSATPQLIQTIKKNSAIQLASLDEVKSLRLTLDADEKEAVLKAVAQMSSEKGAKAFRGSLESLVKFLPLWQFTQTFKGGEDAKRAEHVVKLLGPMKFEVNGNEVRGTTKTDPATMAAAMLYLGQMAQ